MLGGAGFQAGVSSAGAMIAARIVSVSFKLELANSRDLAWVLSTRLAPSSWLKYRRKLRAVATSAHNSAL
jgi:hypothetical protein